MAWHVAPSLKKLRDELNCKYPKRDKTSDGSIGDARHSASVSDHNPNSRRSVNALDIDKDGINTSWLIALLIKDPRVNYVIFNRVIWSRVRGFKARRYTGANPHDKHIHVSILQTKAAESNTRQWFPASTSPVVVKPISAPKPSTLLAAYPGYILKAGMTNRAAVKTLQTRLNALKIGGGVGKVDGDFGKKTLAAVRRFQMDNKLTVDGKVGVQTWTRLFAKTLSV